MDDGLLQGLVGFGGGFMKGMQDAEDRKYKRMEFEAKYKTEAQEREKKVKDQNMNNAFKMRDDWLKNQTTKNTQSVREAYDKIRNAGQSAAGDMSLIYGFMRMQDPGSTVREGEFATAQNAAGVPDQIKNLYNKILTGQRLNPAQRQDFVRQAGSIYGAQKQNQGRLDEEFKRLAIQSGLTPDEIVLKLFGDDDAAPPPPQQVVRPQGLVAPKITKPGAAKVAPKAKGGAPDFDNMSDEELRKYIGQ